VRVAGSVDQSNHAYGELSSHAGEGKLTSPSPSSRLMSRPRTTTKATIMTTATRHPYIVCTEDILHGASVRVHSRRAPSVLAGILVVLFFALSFNAYACLLPVNGVTAGAMGNGCSTPDEQPVSQFCDAFKTLGVQSADKPHLAKDYQAICSEDTASLILRVVLASHNSRLYDHPPDSPPQDLLLKISVLRI